MILTGPSQFTLGSFKHHVLRLFSASMPKHLVTLSAGWGIAAWSHLHVIQSFTATFRTWTPVEMHEDSSTLLMKQRVAAAALRTDCCYQSRETLSFTAQHMKHVLSAAECVKAAVNIKHLQFIWEQWENWRPFGASRNVTTDSAAEMRSLAPAKLSIQHLAASCNCAGAHRHRTELVFLIWLEVAVTLTPPITAFLSLGEFGVQFFTSSL